MKMKQFLKKFYYRTSDIRSVKVRDSLSKDWTELYPFEVIDPDDPTTFNEQFFSKRLESFRIKDNTLYMEVR